MTYNFRLYIVLVISALVISLHAQTKAIDRSFANLTNNSEPVQMSTISGFDGWEFNEYCFAKKSDHAVIGDGTHQGAFTTQPLGVYGNVSFLIRTKGYSSSAQYNISLVGEGTLSTTSYTTSASDYNHPSAILITGCKPSTRIRIEGTSGRFYLSDITAFSIGDAVFYESFDYLRGNGKDEDRFTYGVYAMADSCDNSSKFICNKVHSSLGNVFLYDGGASFTISSLPVASGTKALLTFRYTLSSYNYNTSKLSLNISGSARMTDFNSTNLSNPQSTREIFVTSGQTFEWKDCFVVITDISNTTEVTFSGWNSQISDITLTPIADELDQNKDNSTFIKANAGLTRNAQLLRSLTNDIWCPLCLPFDVTQASANSAMGTTCELRTFDHVTDGVFTFNAISEEQTIPAGTPFLLRVSQQVTNPTFSDVTIVDTPAASVGEGDYHFIGNYSTVSLTTDGTNLFLGTDGKLYKPSTAEGHNRLGGLRAYFEVPAAANEARVFISDEVATGVASIDNSQCTIDNEYYYDLQGRCYRQRPSQKGLYLYRGQKYLVK